VKRVAFAERAEGLGRWRAKPDFKVLGPRLGAGVKEVAAALAAEEGALAAALARGDSVNVPTPSGPVVVEPGEVELTQETLEGWGVGSDAGLTIALELELTDALRREGVARELVRIVQDARKAAGLEVSDRIELGISTSGSVDEALDEHRGWVAAETLATDLRAAELEEATYRQEADVEGTPVVVTLRRPG
jgi:isoleucyl-tRNA synthetase